MSERLLAPWHPADIDKLPDQELATIFVQVQHSVEQMDANHREITRQLRQTAELLAERILHRLDARNATMLAHPEYKIECRRSYQVDKRIAELRALEGLVPERELREALCLRQPEPEWWAHASKLQALARKYGGKVAEIVAQGLVRVQVGSAKLIITPRENDYHTTPPTKELP